MAFSTSDTVVDCQHSLGCSNTSLLVGFYINNGTTRAVPESVQLLLCTVPQFNKLLDGTTRQSTTMSHVENAVYTNIMEIAYSC